MNLNFVNEYLLLPNNLQFSDIESLLEILDQFNIDYADLYFQSCVHENWILEDSVIKSGVYGISQGAGIRVLVGESTGFAYTDKLSFNALRNSIKSAITVANGNLYNNSIVNNQNKACIFSDTNNKHFSAYSSSVNPLFDMSNEEKIDLLMQVDSIARAADSRIQKVHASLSGVHEQILVAATDETLVADVRPLVRLSISLQAEGNGRIEQGVSGGGGRCGYDFFLDTIPNIGESRIGIWTKDAVQMSLYNLSSVEAPSGMMPVVLGPGWPGILLHEAVGHGLEGDFIRKGSSFFSNKIGMQVASELCTVVDDGTFEKSRGSIAIDDEGNPGRYNILIQNGILKGYMQDKLNSKLMGVSVTGNGRRESYAHLPMPRMTNTYMLSGQSKPEDIINSVEYGIYATNFGGGQVDITSGKFVFSTSEAFLIKKGRIATPIKGATLIGSGIEIMQNISMVGNDLCLDQGIGTCVKNGQNIPVCVGQPTIKLDKITVGGTS